MNYYNSFVPDGNNNVTSGSTTSSSSSAAAPLQQSQHPQQSTGLSYFSQLDPRNAVAPPQQQPHYQLHLHRQELRQADQSSLVHFQPYLQHPPPQHQPQQQQPQHQSYTASSMPTTTTTVYLSNLSPSASSSSHNQSIASPPSALATLLAKLSKKHSCLIAPEVIPILEKNCFDETNVLYLDKETLVELQIPIGGRVSLLKIIEEEKKCTSNNNNNDNTNNKQIPHFSPSSSTTTTIPFQGQNFLNHFVVPHHQANNINHHHHHHQNFHHHHEQQEQFQQRPGDRYLRDPELRRAAVVNAQDPELRKLFNSSIHREDWILPPADEQLREKLVNVWGGFDPWNETTCERCKKWAFKVTVEWLPRANRHPTEKCMIFAEDGTPVKQFDRRTLPSSGGINHQNNEEKTSFHDGAKKFGNIVNNGQYQHHHHQHHHHHHHDRFQNFQQQQQQQTKYHQHQNNNTIHQDNGQLHNNNSNNNNTTKTLDPELKQLLQSRFNGADWIDPPSDPQLRAKLVAWWGGRDPWNETICDKCRKWSHKVTQDFYPRSTHHTTDKCAIWADDGTCIKSVAGSGARGQHHAWSDRPQFANKNYNNHNNQNKNNNNEQQEHQTADFVDVYYQEDEGASSETQKMSGQRREREENDEQ